ncbi:MAG: CARDB domain-containing protein [Candidatus Bathyarchaeia archaeon]
MKMRFQSFLTTLFLVGVFILAFPRPASSNSPVLIEFLFYDNFCLYCPSQQIYYQVYVHNSRVIDNIQRDYGDNVLINRIYWVSAEGREKIELYNLSSSDWNTIVVNEEVILKGGDKFVDEVFLKSIIDSYLALEHDIAILDVLPDTRNIVIGETLNLNIIVTNKGKQSESFSIRIYFNETSVGTLSIDSLEPNATQTFHFYFNTTGFFKGFYSLRVYAPPVQNEINTVDNTYSAGMVELKAQNASHTIIHDLAVVLSAPSKSVVNQEQIKITATVKNFGTVAENFTLKVFLNESLIKEVSFAGLNPGMNFSESLILYTYGWDSGNYVIKASVESAGDELDETNNEFLFVISFLRHFDTKLDLAVNTLLAFIFGFFETFSPCLLVLLSIILSYTLGEATDFREGFFKVMLFGTGFVFAGLIVSLVTLSLFFLLPFQNVLILAVCIFATLFGLNMMGLNFSHIFKVKGDKKVFVQKITRNYIQTYVGIVLLGFLFYFLDPCVAPFFFALAPLAIDVNFVLIVLAFCLGVVLPFVGVGIFAGSISKLVRGVYRYKYKLRMVSGLILICYSIYVIICYIFR